MQRRLALALVGVAIASVLLAGVGVLALAQVGARDDARQEAVDRLALITDDLAVGGSFGPAGRRGDDARFTGLVRGLGLAGGGPAFIDASGHLVTLPTSSTRRHGAGDPGPAAGRPLGRLDAGQRDRVAAGEVVTIDDRGSVTAVGRPPAAAQLFVDDLAGVDDDDDDDDDDNEVQLVVYATRPVVTIGSETRLWFALSAGVVLLGSVLLSWPLARHFTTPVAQIEKATAAISDGDFTVRVDGTRTDELGDLGRSVNRMAADLERSRALDQQFLMSVSHDLRTPLTAIAGYAEALRDGAVTDAAHTGEIIGSHAGRLERLVGDLLDLARLDANRFALHIRPVDATVVVGRTVAGLQPRADQDGTALIFEPTASPVTVSADPDRLAQAVGNLIDNALKFADRTVTVTVTSAADRAAIAVADDGPGIGADDLPHIFERLYVGAARPARAENPSGMGLAIVRELTAAMGGEVAATSSPGDGATLTISLPLIER